ncbi:MULTISPECIES: PorP/SprF family type IX secretion system membrane protein [Niastella]|uniref:PorP/SprF family type IX secretion system membrane protein n=1 Tax=Niastella soli TaxID=2821487 RepID=A0ABS3YY78_9BACT|nr:PorP/SprF family type IX secretion system membrane protein [Niastella soli]MBO9202877.1 PorP/SprF family type IX secretion system membrane protein [Niastella soli]
MRNAFNIQLNIKKTYRVFIGGILLAACCQQATAQNLSSVPALLQPSATQYYQNQYLANPAMAGIDSGLHVNAAHRRQWTNIDGAPVNTFITADGALGKSGLGLNIFNDKAGLLNRTRVAFTYAYHLPITTSGEQQLHFGLSVAINTQRASYHDINGDISDPALSAYNNRSNYFEGEYGMAYTDKHLTLQVALPNARTLFTGDDKGVNGGTILFTGAAYKFTTDGAISSIEPKVCYRAIKGNDGIVDAGVNVAFLDNLLNLTALYQTSKNFTAGVGVKILKTVGIQALYTTQTGGIKTYADGTYELGIRADLFR